LKKKSGIGKLIKRELVRAALERSQGFDMVNMTTPTDTEVIVYDDVEETLNIPYVNTEEVPLAMDIFKPKDTGDDELPVIVTIHGGGLTLGDRHISRPLGRLLAHKGYLVFSIEYRLAPRANVCQELGDVCSGMDFVGQNLINYNVDFTCMFLIAESAGAYLAAYVAAMRGSKKLQDAIGFKASRMQFKALGLNCGMFYTNRNDMCGWLLSEQIYGEKRADENFLQYMDPENPEILYNLPPTFFSTSKGDFMNNYTLMLNEAMRKAGKTSHLVYYPNEDLQHAFLTMQVTEPETLECIDKMLGWLEAQADKDREIRKLTSPEAKAYQKLEKKKESGSIAKQSAYGFVKEMTSFSPAVLKKTALIDCTREYTFQQMFDEADRYAKVFTGLGMTFENNSRVALAGTISAEPLFAFFGLSATGATVSMFSYPDFLPGGMWKTMIEKEKITDLILSDIMVTPDLWYELADSKEKLGLRNVILMHSRLGGPCAGPAELVFDEFNYHALKTIEGTVFMEDLLKEYATTEISFHKPNKDHISVITHTSGSTKGTRKPLPFTDWALNTAACAGFGVLNEGTSASHIDLLWKSLRFAPSFDFSSLLCICSAVTFLAGANTVVLTFFGFIHPKFVRAIDYYKLNVLFTSGFMLDNWMSTPGIEDIDFSSIKMFACGGSYISPEKLKKYKGFLKDRGFEGSFFRGYGMSEVGGSQLLAPPDRDDDILGIPQNKEDFLIKDENNGRYYTAFDGERTGILYAASGSLCLNELDGEVLFEYTEIKGRNYICTNDLVRANGDGSLSYAGRADKYFVNNDGVRFESGIVEKQMGSRDSISKCAIVPVLDKRIHDTVPVLYIVTADEVTDDAEAVRKALVEIFIEGNLIKKSSLPSQFVLVDDIPLGPTGKLDIYRITRERLEGQAYNIVPVYEDGKLVDIKAEFTEQLSSIKAGSLPEGMGSGSALGIFEVFNQEQTGTPNFLDLILLLNQKTNKKKKEKDKQIDSGPPQMPMPPKKVLNAANKVVGKLYGQKRYDTFFEV
jgi:acetyl esterase/lipase/acyl-coenzyme A synthetase/AMP-(fatty) acid ligase